MQNILGGGQLFFFLDCKLFSSTVSNQVSAVYLVRSIRISFAMKLTVRNPMIITSRIDTDVDLEVACRCNFSTVSDSLPCSDIANRLLPLWRH